MGTESAPRHLRVHTMGTTVGLDLDHDWLTDEEVEALRRMWSRTLRDDRAPSEVELLGVSVRSAGTFPRLANALSSAVTLAALRHQAGRLLQLHAAGLAEPATGRTIAFVASSGTGKTTVARTLGTDWGYLTDETVAIDPDTLAVLSHPKPLSVGRSGSIKEQHGPDDLGLLPEPPSARLARIVLLVRDPEHPGAPRLEPVTLAEALGALTPEVSYLSRWEHPLAMMAQVVTRTGGVLRLTYADVGDLRGLPETILKTPGTEQDWEHVPDSRVHDSVATDHGLAVFEKGPPDQVVVLDGIGPTVWRLLGERDRSTDELVEAVVAELGEPPNGSAEDAVRACLDALRERGLISDNPA